MKESPVSVEERAKDDGLEALYSKRQRIAVPQDHCTHYIERGFRLVRCLDDRAFLDPPTALRDLRYAASVCLYHPMGNEVLLGRRLTKPWKGYWAFPGGSLEPGETALEAARRELGEETEVDIDAATTAILETIVYVSSGNGEKVYQVTNFVIPSERVAARRTGEIDPHWVKISALASREPMAVGTETVIARLKDLLKRSRKNP